MDGVVGVGAQLGREGFRGSFFLFGVLLSPELVVIPIGVQLDDLQLDHTMLT